MSDPKEITCSCQHCNGHIKFDADLLKPSETKHVECPHCHLETIIHRPSVSTVPKVFTNPSEGESGSSKTILLPKKTKSSKIELFLFELTRFPMIAGAILVLLSILVVAFLIAQTRTTEKPPPLPIISYEMVAPTPEPPATPVTTGEFVPQGAKMAKKNSFPQPVIDFLLKHQGFTLKEWLDQLTPEQRQAFLKNLATVLVAAKSDADMTDEKMAKVVKDFGEKWIGNLLESEKERLDRIQEKQRQYSLLITQAFELFISLMVLCLVLVLLAIERNTRPNEKSKEVV